MKLHSPSKMGASLCPTVQIAKLVLDLLHQLLSSLEGHVAAERGEAFVEIRWRDDAVAVFVQKHKDAAELLLLLLHRQRLCGTILAHGLHDTAVSLNLGGTQGILVPDLRRLLREDLFAALGLRQAARVALCDQLFPLRRKDSWPLECFEAIPLLFGFLQLALLLLDAFAFLAYSFLFLLRLRSRDSSAASVKHAGGPGGARGGHTALLPTRGIASRRAPALPATAPPPGGTGTGAGAQTTHTNMRAHKHMRVHCCDDGATCSNSAFCCLSCSMEPPRRPRDDARDDAGRSIRESKRSRTSRTIAGNKMVRRANGVWDYGVDSA